MIKRKELKVNERINTLMENIIILVLWTVNLNIQNGNLEIETFL